MATSLLEVKGIGPAAANLLAGHDIKCAEDLANARLGAVTAVQGFSDIRASRVIEAARALLRGATAESIEPRKKSAAVKQLTARQKGAKKKDKKKKGAKKKGAKKKTKKDKKPKAEKQAKQEKAARVKKSSKAEKQQKAKRKKSGKKK